MGTEIETAATLHRYSPDRPILLVTEYSPDATGGGAVILRSLLGAKERLRVVWFSLSPSAEIPATTKDWAGCGLLARGSAGRHAGKRSPWLDSTIYTRAISDEILERAHHHRAQALWLVMHGAIVPVAARLARTADLPIHLTVHDDPVGHAVWSRRYIALTPRVMRDFAKALRKARSIDTICTAMSERYLCRYGVHSTVVHRGTEGPVAPSPAYDRAAGLSIGIIGNFYEYSMLLVLAEAVEHAANQLGVRGRIVFVGHGMGEKLRDDMAARLDVELTGQLADPAAVERLRRCFLLYVNYPFGMRKAIFRQTSYPTKLSTYALAARPLIAHMPADASVVPLTRENPSFASHWSSLSVAEGAAHLVRLWNDPACVESQHEPAELLRSQVYDMNRNRATLFGALNQLVKPSPN